MVKFGDPNLSLPTASAQAYAYKQLSSKGLAQANASTCTIHSHRCQPWSSSWRDINCNIVGLGAGRWDRKPFPRLRGITDWIRDFQLFA